MLVKLIIVIFLLMIMYSLGSALYFLVKERSSKKDDSIRVIKALTWRITLSLLLFILLFVSFWLGWIQPHQV